MVAAPVVEKFTSQSPRPRARPACPRCGVPLDAETEGGREIPPSQLQSTTIAPPRDIPPLADVVRDLVERVRRLEALEDRRGLADRELIRAILDAYGASVFSAAELIQRATVDPALRRALGDAVRPKQAGHYLERLRGIAYGGYMLTRLPRDNRGTVWCLVQTDAALHADP